MRKKIILILLVGIIAISSFSIGFISILVINNAPNNDTNNLNIAIEDSYVRGYNNNDSFGNLEYLKIEEAIPVGWREHTYILMKFDVSNYNETCVLSFYIYRITPNSIQGDGSIGIYIFKSGWNEDMNSREIINSYVDDREFEYGIMSIPIMIGLVEIDISDYLQYTNDTITLRLRHLPLDGEVYIYSKEANVNKEYLPQLIWS